MAKIDLSSMDLKQVLVKYWYVFALIVIVAMGFYLRALPARFGELQALDPFYLYRMSEAVVENNLSVLQNDSLRYYPNGINFWDTEFLMPVYGPAYSYMFLSAIGMQMTFLDFAIIWPAVMGSMAVLASFLLGRELFHSNYAGLFTAFFMATTPAFLTRTSAGFFEKEPISAPFIVLSIYFFIKAFRKSSWRDGAMAGLMLTVVGMSWGGVSYLYLLFAGFLGFLYATNFVVVAVDYLFGGMTHVLQRMEPFFSMKMVKAYVPTILISAFITSIFPRNVLASGYLWITFAVIGVIAVKLAVERFSLVKHEYMPFVIPSVLAFGFMFMMVGSMFSDTLWVYTNSVSGLVLGITHLAPPASSVVTTTVAENAPGSWNNIFSMLGNTFALNSVPGFAGLQQYFALWLFMFLGMGLLVYRFYRTHNWMMILPLFWGITTILGILYRVRLAFLLGPPAAVLGGFFCAWLMERSFRAVKKEHFQVITRHSLALFFSVLAGFSILVLYKNVFGIASFVMLSILSIGGIAYYTNRKMGVQLKSMLPLLVVAFLGFVVSLNFINSLVYASSIGPSICFTRGGSKCLTYDENGEIVLNPDQPWYQAMNFFAEETPKDSVVLSWWDFGYWFQTRGKRPSVVDGGHLGGRRDFEVAQWYTDKTENWGKWTDWLKKYSVDYILMDYTLPGKYGAISKIASNGEKIVGFLEFQKSGMYPKDNKTVYTFTAGPYELWIPITDNGGIEMGSTPMLLVKQGDQYASKTYINDVCTTSGIIRVGEEEQALPGCVAMSSLGVFFIPEEAEYTIFTRLMFMDGYGLPVEKVFDNQIIKIYKVNYPEE